MGVSQNKNETLAMRVGPVPILRHMGKDAGQQFRFQLGTKKRFPSSPPPDNRKHGRCFRAMDKETTHF